MNYYLKTRKPRRSKYFEYLRQQHICSLLSIPKKPLLDEELKKPPAVSPASLRAHCRRRVKFLAKPHPRRIRLRTKDASIQKSSAVLGTPTPWNIVAALPKYTHIARTKNHFFENLGKRQQKAAENTMKKVLAIYKATHPSDGVQSDHIVNGVLVHMRCIAGPKKQKFRYLCELDMKERERFIRHLNEISQPLPPPIPKKPYRGKRKPLAEMQKKIEELSKPAEKEEEKRVDPFKVKPEALWAQTTDRINSLSRHKELPPPEPFYDFKGNELPPRRVWDFKSIQKIVASDRTKELAVPKRERKKAAETAKDNPFAVKPAALKAVATETLIRLAQPSRKGRKNKANKTVGPRKTKK